jgi:hypothetical protein
MEHYEQYAQYAHDRYDEHDGYGRPKSKSSTMRCYEMRDRRTTR